MRNPPLTGVNPAEAREASLRLARSHYENFTVVSWLTPRSLRKDLASIYAYCRTVDDLGDEAEGDRLELLDRFEEELERAYAGTPRHPVFISLLPTIERFDLPREPFARLIEANRIDQVKTRYASFADLLEYCENSANPVGRLVLMLYGYRDDERFALSDATCTALQLTNFWQDIRRDYEMGRIYLPQDEMERFGVGEDDLALDHAPSGLRGLLRFQVDRTREYFERGLPLIDTVEGHLKIDLALFSRGGLAILKKIEDQRYDTLSRRPRLSNGEKALLFLSTLISTDWRRWI